MGDVIYVSSNSFKTTQSDALDRLGDPNIYIQLKSVPVVATSSIWDVYSSTFSDINVPQDWSILTGSAGVVLTPQQAWDAYKQVERLSVVSVGGGLVQFVKLVRVISATAITGFTLAVIADQMSRSWESWSGGTVPNNQIPINGNTGNGSVVINLGTGSGDILGTGMLLNDIYLNAEDPTQFLIQIFDEDGDLIASGYPNINGYFNPQFVDTEWYDITFGSSNCPVDQVASEDMWDVWPPEDALFVQNDDVNLLRYFDWLPGTKCYQDRPDPTTGPGVFINPIEVEADGDHVEVTTLYAMSAADAPPVLNCSGMNLGPVWCYVDVPEGATSIRIYHNRTTSLSYNIEIFRDVDGSKGSLTYLDSHCDYYQPSGWQHKDIDTSTDDSRLYVRITCPSDDDVGGVEIYAEATIPSIDGETFDDAIELSAGVTEYINNSAHGSSVETGEPAYSCVAADNENKIWFYFDYDGSGDGFYAFARDDLGVIKLSIEAFSDSDGTISGLSSVAYDCPDYAVAWVEPSSPSSGRYYFRVTSSESGNSGDIEVRVDTTGGGGA